MLGWFKHGDTHRIRVQVWGLCRNTRMMIKIVPYKYVEMAQKLRSTFYMLISQVWAHYYVNIMAEMPHCGTHSVGKYPPAKLGWSVLPLIKWISKYDFPISLYDTKICRYLKFWSIDVWALKCQHKIGFIVKLREREGQRVDSGSRLSNCQIVDCRLSISISLKLYTKVGCHPPPPPGSLNTLD